jgi:hypothetical protein
MGKRIVLGGLLAVLAACGGSVDPGSTGDPAPPLAPSGEQGIYRPTASGGPDAIAQGVGVPSALALTPERVIFTTRSTVLGGVSAAAGAVFVADKRVGPPLMLTVDRQGASFDGLVVDGDTVFVATGDARLLAVPVMGGAPAAVATLAAAAVALAVSGDHVYYATKTGAVARVAKKGGAVEPLATITGTVRGLEADRDAVYVATGAGEETGAGILRVTLDGKVEPLALGSEPCAMVKDGRSLYWTSAGAKGEVRRVSLDGGNASTVIQGSFTACGIAADATSVYFATSLPDALPVRAGGTSTTSTLGLMRAPLAGGEPVAIARGSRALTQSGAVAVDATHIYWLTDTAVLRLRK